MYVLTVLYHHPTDPEAFDAHFHQVHTPLVRAVPGLATFTAQHCTAPDGGRPAFHLLARGEFASRADYERATASAETQAAEADLANFARAGSVSLLTHD